MNRGNVFYSQQDRLVYLNLLRDNLKDTQVRVLAYCLMTNHIHAVVIPEREDSLAVLFRRVHGRYAQYFNARRGRTGHLWQNRFYSSVVGRDQEVRVLRYVENNPVRAGITEHPEDYQWSSAAAHLVGRQAELISVIDWEYWENHGGAAWWRTEVHGAEDTREVSRIRRATYAGAPIGSDEFIQQMEQQFRREWRQIGRPQRATTEVVK